LQIDRRSNLDRKTFEAEYVARSRPVILADAIDAWPARRKWTFDYFAERYGDKVLDCRGERWTIIELLAALATSTDAATTPYLKEIKLDQQFPELWGDVGTIALAAGNQLRNRLLPKDMQILRGIVALFIGSKGSGFRALHWDYTWLHVFISQVHGDKDAVLFAPSDTRHLYADPEADNKSLLPSVEDVDLARYPAFAKATPIKVTIAEGETLFIPGGWWHATSIHGPSIAIAESYLDRHNWNVRKDWYLESYRRDGISPLRLRALDLYLRAIKRLI
jgi:hypothetical protein